MDDRNSAIKALLEIESNPQSITKYFPIVESAENFFQNEELLRLGFWKCEKLANEEIGADFWKTVNILDPEIDQLSLGNLLSELLEPAEYLPKTLPEALALRRFFQEPSMTVGMFGNFKFILKALTDRLIESTAELDRDVFYSLVGSIGLGYGQVDAYLSKGSLPPAIFDRYWEEVTDPSAALQRQLSALHEFKSRAYPSLPTSQYLSRKGLRFYKALARMEDRLPGAIFKASVLSTSDSLDQNSERNSSYQLLSNMLLFSSSSDVTREKSGRKVKVSEQPDYFNAVKIELSDATLEELEVLNQWVPSIEGNNRHLDIYRAVMSLELGVETTWKSSAVRYLSKSSDAKVQRAIGSQIAKAPELFAECDPSQWPTYMRALPLDSLDQVLSHIQYKQFPVPPYHSLSYTLVANWLSSLVDETLSEKEIQISQKVISQHWMYYVEDKPKYLGVLLKLAKQTQLQPGQLWTALTAYDSNQFNLESYLDFLGLNPESHGLFTVVDAVPREMLEAASTELDNALSWGNSEKGKSQRDIFKEIFEFESPIFITLLANALARMSFKYNYENDTFSKFLQEHIATEHHQTLKEEFLRGAFAYFLNNTVLNPTQPMDVLLRYLILSLNTDLGRELCSTHPSEIEASLHGSRILPAYVWNNIETFPEGAPNYFVESAAMREDLMSHVTPSFVGQITEAQTQLLAALLAASANSGIPDSLLKALLLAPNQVLNKLGVTAALESNRIQTLWLVMIESDLSITSKAGLEYLQSQKDSKQFEELLMQALDSNNSFARRSALELLESQSSSKLTASIISQLTESRNADTWGIITNNMDLIADVRNLQRFTRRLFLSKRRSRIHKERVKQKISSLVRNLEDILEKDLLLKLSLGSNQKDREWALKKIAHGDMTIQDVIVETTWKVEKNV